jgi:regulator of sirC expression with transglutaminase-like and TPR domain
MNTTEIRALIELLQDDDPRIQEAVGDRLSDFGPEALPALREASESDEPRLRVRARALVHDLRADQRARELGSYLRRGDAGLEEAATLLAAMENPDLDTDPIVVELTRLGRLVRRGIDAARTPRSRALVLGEVLHEGEGFIGNAGDYYDPRNSYVDQVLQRRLGIPISLSVIYILAGRHAGLEMVGVGLPMHFLALYREGTEEFLIDPFGGGRLMTREACRALLAGFRQSFRREYLRPVSDRAILRRIMANLVRIYYERRDSRRLGRLYRLIKSIQEPDS